MSSKSSRKAKKSGPSHAVIAARAYELWIQGGRQQGFSEQHWFDAEKELRGAPPADYAAQEIDYGELGIDPDPQV